MMISYYLFTQISSNSRYSMFSTSSLFILKSKGLRMNNNKNNKYKKNKQKKQCYYKKLLTFGP